MGQRGVHYTIIYKAIYIMFGIAILMLAWNSYHHFLELKEIGGAENGEVHSISSAPIRNGLIDSLETEAQQVVDRLSYMTFSVEREREALKLQRLQQKMLNRYPFHSNYWETLIFAESEVSVPIEQRVWSINVGLRIRGWDKQYRARVASHCLKTPSDLYEAAPLLCTRLLVKMDRFDMTYVAGIMRVNPRTLKTRIHELELQFGFNSKALTKQD